ncbi:UDP-2,4-diacetamido-2,4,6-trideoxy-beta-L-altropy ranose hydrolase [Cohnella xylanilytica]|uniref:UDP-2,4-diacetamido-2,4, 6-trideoxy-beta-L-altropyranose hydrolase n=1 Tax=Cohnella xylanilytica TaxID=557555 RepID=UPI001B2AD9F4|nr:UDP-2,4-diacetamido-2,4,6-trideoxy-beta-L-altropyranose hydrolase [Cohnella xylanilytica]GIO10582.1 UDP-2,4-diacetamido-2,4,6-trideoxy-beta-L-altropy ranose hydrolase [Cohnella xylanilytica]
MNVYIRADASVRIGTGHVMRCLSLADELRERGAKVAFLCRELEGNLISYIRERGYPARTIGELPSADSWLVDAKRTLELLDEAASEGAPADWLVVDHYSLDRRYELIVGTRARRIMVVDDLANRPHRCDLLLDQNYYEAPRARYVGLVPDDCSLLLGPRYALLRPEFAEARSRVRRAGAVRRALVSFGGTDPGGVTLTALRALAPLAAEGLGLTVVAGKLNRDAEAIELACREVPNARFIRHADRMAELMAEADLAIGAGGATTWERCCLGLPSLIVTIADNQRELTEQAEAAGAVRCLGTAESVDERVLREAVLQLMDRPSELSRMSENAMKLTDGRGAEIVAKEMLGW